MGGPVSTVRILVAPRAAGYLTTRQVVGNIGSALLRRLVATGRHELVGVVRRPPEAVVHLAWGFQPSHREDQLAALGVGGTQRVIGAVTAAKVPHLVHMSSLGAYSPQQDDAPVDESWPTGGVPTSMYSRHRVAAARLLDRLETDAPEVVVTRMRPGIVGQRNAGSALLRYALRAVTAQDIAHVVGARLARVPSAAVRAAVSVLRPRSVVRSLGRFARRGPVSSRQRP